MTTYKRVDGDYIIKTLGVTDIVNIESTTTVITGDLSVSGNATLLGNISGDKLFNGTSNVEIAAAGGNVTIGVGGTSVATYATTGHYINGLESVTGNITGGNINTAGLVTAIGNVNGGNVNTAGNIIITRDASVSQPTIRFTDTDTTVSDGTVLGAVEWYTSDLAPSARVTSAIRSIASGVAGNANVEILTSTNGAAATQKFVVLSTGNVGIANSAPLDALAVTGNAYVSANVIGGNILSSTSGQISTNGNVTGGNIITATVYTNVGNAGVAIVNGGGNLFGNIGNASGYFGTAFLKGITVDSGGVSATGNITGGNVNSLGIASITGNIIGGNVILGTTLSASGNVIGGNVVVSGANISGNSFGTGIGVENIVWQPTTVAFSSASIANIGVLTFPTLAGASYKYEAYLPIIPDGTTTTGFSTYFQSGTCYYTVEFQTTQTSTFNTSTSNVSATAPATASMSGVTPHAARITGTFYSASAANVAIMAQTSVANINIQSGAYLTYTRIG